MKVFITGGSGFVGQNLIPILQAAGYEVYAIARSKKSARFVQKLGAKSVRDDLTNLSRATQNALKDCDYVLHSAAHMDFTYDPKPFEDLNIKATNNLLKMAQRGGVREFVENNLPVCQ